MASRKPPVIISSGSTAQVLSNVSKGGAVETYDVEESSKGLAAELVKGLVRIEGELSPEQENRSILKLLENIEALNKRCHDDDPNHENPPVIRALDEDYPGAEYIWRLLLDRKHPAEVPGQEDEPETK